MTTCSKHHLFRLGTFMCLLILATSSVAQSPDSIEEFVFPRNGASVADDIYVLYGDNCGRPHPDPTRAPVVTHGEDEIVVEIYLVEPESPICPAVVLPDTILAVPLGKLDEGAYLVTRRLMVRTADSDRHSELHASNDVIEIGDTPNPAASGSWYDADAPGTGIMLNLLPGTDGVAGSAVLFLATFEPDGTPQWLSGAGAFGDARLTVPLRRAGTDGSMPPDATGLFEYVGCGEARLSVTGTALGFPVGTVNLKQLTLTAGLPGCEPPETLPQDFD